MRVMNIQPWQMNILKKLQGFKPGEMTVMMARRNTGKSAFSAQAFQRLWEDLHHRPIEELKLTEGTVYGKRYHCVEPVGGYWPEMEAWCFETFGKTEGSIWAETKTPMPNERWYMNNRKFWFRDEVDRTIFILKWR